MEGGRIKPRCKDERGQDAQQACYITIQNVQQWWPPWPHHRPKPYQKTLTPTNREDEEEGEEKET
jgi:hypothetical protein